jgi:hypothetical protein
MRFILYGLAAIAATTTASAQVHVNGYTKKDGTYVAPHYRSSPDGNPYNNYSTLGNVNPYTGQAGTKIPDSSPRPNSYGTYGSRPSPNPPKNLNSQKCLYSWSC